MEFKKNCPYIWTSLKDLGIHKQKETGVMQIINLFKMGNSRGQEAEQSGIDELDTLCSTFEQVFVLWGQSISTCLHSRRINVLIPFLKDRKKVKADVTALSYSDVYINPCRGIV